MPDRHVCRQRRGRFKAAGAFCPGCFCRQLVEDFVAAAGVVAQEVANASRALAALFAGMPPEVLAALVEPDEDGGSEDPHTPDTLRALLGAPTDGARAVRFTAEGGFSDA